MCPNFKRECGQLWKCFCSNWKSPTWNFLPLVQYMDYNRSQWFISSNVNCHALCFKGQWVVYEFFVYKYFLQIFLENAFYFSCLCISWLALQKNSAHIISWLGTNGFLFSFSIFFSFFFFSVCGRVGRSGLCHMLVFLLHESHVVRTLENFIVYE